MPFGHCSLGGLHAQTYGEAVDTEKLIPHMLQLFVPEDWAFSQGNGTGK